MIGMPTQKSTLPTTLAVIAMVLVFAFQIQLHVIRSGEEAVQFKLEYKNIAYGYHTSIVLCRGNHIPNGTKLTPEECDDGNSTNNDGCSMFCKIETGYTCSGTTPSVCYICGNGVRVSAEECDDGDTTAGDGCSDTCTIETDYTCSGAVGAISICTAGACGNGTRGSFEDCDDGNATAGYGCSATCTVETGFSCTGAVGATSVCSSACGDGAKAASEQCDDGNASNTDSCLTTCVSASCGDTYLQSGVEQCEPPGQGSCNNSCQVVTGAGTGGGSGGGGQAEPPKKLGGPRPACGNGIVEPAKGEECDKGIYNGLNPTCTKTCKFALCGDGLVNPDVEECEPLKNVDGTFTFHRCGKSCTLPYCSQDPANPLQQVCAGGCRYIVFPDKCSHEVEEEIKRQSFLQPAPILSGPTGIFGAEGPIQNFIQSFIPPIFNGPIVPVQYVPVCGDARIERGEGCDDDNILDGDGCSAICTMEQSAIDRCGNGLLEIPEGCDDGQNNSDVITDSCRMTCQLPHCGDSVQDTGEQCDDGNDIAGDGCTPTCERNICNNGHLEPGEECDDGERNAASPNSCRPTCLVPRCGDGIYDTNWGEQCDRGSLNSNENSDACRLNCLLPSCGDNVLDAVEQCDDGNGVDNDGCDNTCHPTHCGDGTVQAGEECDDGNNIAGDSCAPTCSVETSVPLIEAIVQAAVEGLQRIAAWFGL